MKNDIDYMEFLRSQTQKLFIIGSHDVRPRHVKPKRAKRKCLGCQNKFTSDGPHNHVCGRCNGHNSRVGIAGAYGV